MKNKFVWAVILAVLMALSLGARGQNRKSVSILGDSYSTFERFLEPDTNEVWYKEIPDRKRTDVDNVRQTWWHMVIRENGFKLDTNNSYSGATISTSGYRHQDYTDRAFFSRMDNLGCPDIIFIFGATNDSWARSPIGEFKWSDWTKEDLKSFRPALAYTLSHMVDRYPNTEIIYLINSELKPEITSSVVEACQRYGIPYIQLHDIDKTAGHPNQKGMRQIADQVNAYLKKQ